MVEVTAIVYHHFAPSIMPERVTRLSQGDPRWAQIKIADEGYADISNSLKLGLIDNQGVANSLSSKLNAASVAATGGDNTTTANVLQAFTNEVNAQTGKHITGIAPQVLLADATSLISQLR